MIDHIGFPVKNLDAAKAFYQKTLEPLGYQLIAEFGDFAGFGRDGKPDFWIGKSETGTTSMHIAVNAANRADVDAFYEAAIKAGAKDNGAPGVREIYHPDYYGAFVIDPEGYNLEAVCHAAA